MRRTIFFDLEGPLSPQDNAYEVMKLVGKEGKAGERGKEGARVFEAISKYDDFISLQEREGYEPGDTLALIVPFLLLHGVTEAEIKRVSERAKLVDGARELFERLQEGGGEKEGKEREKEGKEREKEGKEREKEGKGGEKWEVYIISTSYEQHAYNVGRRLGVPEENIVCTRLDLEGARARLGEEEAFFSLVEKVEEDLIGLYSSIDEAGRERFVSRLDEFFFRQLPALGYDVLGATRVVGGERKAEAVRKIARAKGVRLSEVIAVGDSITDYKMLREVAQHGGVAVVFNGNEYAVPYANVGLASLNVGSLWVLCDAFARGGKRAVFEEVRRREEEKRGREEEKRWRGWREEEKRWREEEKRGEFGEFSGFGGFSGFEIPYFHNLERADERRRAEIIKLHKAFRMRVREDAGRLG
ncbi:MAG: HAD hydrolase family protein [Methanophagales archaeon]|nr:HAD hydrolase family protein [Methanophagales archaeon]